VATVLGLAGLPSRADIEARCVRQLTSSGNAANLSRKTTRAGHQSSGDAPHVAGAHAGQTERTPQPDPTG